MLYIVYITPSSCLYVKVWIASNNCPCQLFHRFDLILHLCQALLATSVVQRPHSKALGWNKAFLRNYSQVVLVATERMQSISFRMSNWCTQVEENYPYPIFCLPICLSIYSTVSDFHLHVQCFILTYTPLRIAVGLRTVLYPVWEYYRMMAQICSFLFLNLELHRTDWSGPKPADPGSSVFDRNSDFPSQAQSISLIICGLMFSDGPTKASLDSLTLAWDKEEDNA